jgi:hypothetical protein
MIEIPNRVESRTDDLRETISENSLPVAVGMLILTFGVVRYGIPGWIITIGLGLVYGLIPAYILGIYVVQKTFPDTRREVIEIDLSDDDDSISARSWFVPEKVWRNRRRGERPEIYPEHGAHAIVTELEDLEGLNQIRVEGANRDLADPVSIIKRDSKLKEIEENLIDQAERADKLEATLRSKALEIQRENVHSLLAAVEKGTQMDPGAVQNSIEGIELDLDVSPGDPEIEKAQPDRILEPEGEEQPEQSLEQTELDRIGKQNGDSGFVWGKAP